ncbi:hypothetical protein EV664_11332 [Stakelama pacifica]|uniref:Uncharacterized protein n=1 Tax=Stakelama pacifica TaxID=517720 RepID=A0A4R6FFS0_9SPHN|nr:hypothetical protein EV664_11332 [Stakelama pacifica]
MPDLFRHPLPAHPMATIQIPTCVDANLLYERHCEPRRGAAIQSGGTSLDRRVAALLAMTTLR